MAQQAMADHARECRPLLFGERQELRRPVRHVQWPFGLVRHGRTTKGVIEDSMLSAETLAKTGREMRELRRHQRENAQSPFVFVSERGAPLSAPDSVQGLFPRLIYVARVCFEIKSRPVRAVGN